MTNILKIALAIGFMISSLSATVKDFQLRELENRIVKREIPNCLNVTSYYDVVYCSGKVYSILDDALNKAYSNARKKITKSQRKQLKKVQIQWIHNRDDTCARINDSGVILNLSCAKKQTVESLLYLIEIEKNPQDFNRLLNEYKNGN
jgi:uncharacterized protein YecT (DUF1311 family)